MAAASMMEIRKELKHRIDLADDITVKMIKAILDVKDDENSSTSWEDEMEMRFEEMEQGKGVSLTIDQLETNARNSFKNRSAINNEAQ